MHALAIQALALGGLNVEDSFFALYGTTSLATHATSTYYWLFWWISLKLKISSYLIQLHGLGSHSPWDPYFKRRIHGPHFLFINWDHNPTTSSTSKYGSSSSNELKLIAHITSLIFMENCFLLTPHFAT